MVLQAAQRLVLFGGTRGNHTAGVGGRSGESTGAGSVSRLAGPEGESWDGLLAVAGSAGRVAAGFPQPGVAGPGSPWRGRQPWRGRGRHRHGGADVHQVDHRRGAARAGQRADDRHQLMRTSTHPACLRWQRESEQPGGSKGIDSFIRKARIDINLVGELPRYDEDGLNCCVQIHAVPPLLFLRSLAGSRVRRRVIPFPNHPRARRWTRLRQASSSAGAPAATAPLRPAAAPRWQSTPAPDAPAQRQRPHTRP